MTTMKAKADSFADRYGKTIITWVVLVVSAWVTLDARVDQKADRSEVQAVNAKLENITNKLDMLVSYICQTEAGSLGCQPTAGR